VATGAGRTTRIQTGCGGPGGQECAHSVGIDGARRVVSTEGGIAAVTAVESVLKVSNRVTATALDDRQGKTSVKAPVGFKGLARPSNESGSHRRASSSWPERMLTNRPNVEPQSDTRSVTRARLLDTGGVHVD